MASEELMQELLAHGKLSKQGSVMAKGQQPEWRRNLPQTLGPTAGTGAQAALDLLDALLALGPSPLDAAGGGGAADNLAGVFRDIGLKRVSGDLSPIQYLMELQMQPRYERYRQLVQGMVRRGLGERFPVFRGKEQTDPLIKALMQGESRLPAVTAVSLDPQTAQSFAHKGVQYSRKPAYVMKGQATPESVQALVPRRGTPGAHEQELVINPNLTLQRQLVGKASLGDYGSVHWTKPGTRAPLPDIMKVLLEGGPVRKMQSVGPRIKPAPWEAANNKMLELLAAGVPYNEALNKVTGIY
jgi:hypothetical protein